MALSSFIKEDRFSAATTRSLAAANAPEFDNSLLAPEYDHTLLAPEFRGENAAPEVSNPFRHRGIVMLKTSPGGSRTRNSGLLR